MSTEPIQSASPDPARPGPATPFPTSQDPHRATAGAGIAAIGSAAERLAQVAQQTVQRLSEAAAPVLDRARSAGGDLRGMEEAWIESTRASVRERPVGALMVAFAAGVLIGALAVRR